MKEIYKKYTSVNLVLRIVIALGLGLLLGLVLPNAEAVVLLGTLFVGALKAIAPILVFLLVVSSLMNSSGRAGKKISLVIFLYLISTFIASLIAVFASFAFPVKLILTEAAATEQAPENVLEIFKNLLTSIVSNPVEAVSTGNYLCILFWAVIVGIIFKTVARDTSKQFVSDIKDTFTKIIGGVIQFAPVGIFGLVYSTVSEHGVEVFKNYASIIGLLIGIMLFQAFVVNAIIVALTIKSNPYPLMLKCIRKSGVTAFFTRSSAANTVGIEVSIPLTIVCSIVAALGACGTSGVAGGSLLLIPMGCALLGISGDVAMEVVAVGFIISFIQDSM